MAFGHHPLPSPSLCGRVTLSVGVHSVYAPVGESGGLLASFDLREAYIPVPVHPASRPFLRFLFRDTVYQFQALCFGLSTAPQVFTWVMAQDLEAPILASMVCLRGLQWWLHLPRLYLGVSLHQVSPVLHFWSDVSDVDWGSHLDCQVASGLWDTRQAALSIYARERLAVQLGLCHFRSPLRGRTVAVFCDKPQLCIPFARGVAPGLLSSPPWLRRSCGVHLHPPASTVPSGLRHRPNRLPVSPSPAPTSRVVYTHDRLSVFEKTVAGSNGFFATSATHRGSIYFSPFRDP